MTPRKVRGLNGGTLVTPHCVRSVRDPLHPDRNRDFTVEPRGKVRVSRATLAFLREALWYVVNAYGTGGRAKVEGKDVCGKTGTTQLVREIDRKKLADLKEHSWFVGFAPRDDARIAYAIIVEHGGHGSEAAAPIAKMLVEAYYASREPSKPTPPDLVADAR